MRVYIVHIKQFLKIWWVTQKHLRKKNWVKPIAEKGQGGEGGRASRHRTENKKLKKLEKVFMLDKK